MTVNHYKEGSHNVICDLCGKKYKNDQMRPTWNGFMACPNDWYPKPVNEMPRPIFNDSRPVPNSRPRHFTPVTLGYMPMTKWTTTNLQWTTPNWRWDDIQSNSGITKIGQDITLTSLNYTPSPNSDTGGL